MEKLIPRLDYRYGFKDVIVACTGVFKEEHETNLLSSLYYTGNIFFYNHARVGIKVALSSLRLPKEAKIGVVIYNCHTVFNAIREAGYIPVFIDITERFVIDLEDLLNKVEILDALIVTHLFGIPNNLDDIFSLMKKRIPVIEDCAHSFLSGNTDGLTGLKGDIAVFSFGKGKFPSIGEGGFTLVNNLQFLSFIESHHLSLRKRTQLDEMKNILTSVMYSFLHNPYVYKYITLPKLKAIDKKFDFAGKFVYNEQGVLKSNRNLFLYKLQTLSKIVKQRKNKVLDVLELIENTSGLLSPHIKEENVNVFMLPIKRKDFENIAKHDCLKNHEIDMHFKNCLLWAKSFGYENNSCKNAEKIVKEYITFPIYKV